jgi:hypothetical protein
MSAADTQPELDTVGQARGDVRAQNQAIDHRIDGVAAACVEFSNIFEMHQFSIDPRPHQSLAAHALEHRRVPSTLIANQRSQYLHATLCRQRHHRVHDLRRALPGDELTAHRAGRGPHPGKEQPQKIVDLRGGGHRAARTASRAPLLDSDGGTQAVNALDIGFGQLIQILPGMHRQRLDVTPLPFGKERVKRQTALARTAQPGDHGHARAGNVHVHPAQIVLPGSANLYELVLASRHPHRPARMVTSPGCVPCASVLPRFRSR